VSLNPPLRPAVELFVSGVTPFDVASQSDGACLMPETGATGEQFEIQSSRVWAALTFNVTKLLFPSRMYADSHGVSTINVGFWLMPWVRSDEHLPMSHIAEVGHERGFLWDSISVESSGGLNPLTIAGLPKGPAKEFVAHVRNMSK
jgi:hypothetical protein